MSDDLSLHACAPDSCRLVVGSSWVSNTFYPAIKGSDSPHASFATIDEHNVHLPMPTSDSSSSSSGKKKNSNVVIDTKESPVHHSIISAVTAYENQHFGQYKVRVKRHNNEVLWLGCGIDGKKSYAKSLCCFKVKCKYTSPKELKIIEINLSHNSSACQGYTRTREVSAKAVGQQRYKKIRNKVQLAKEKAAAIVAASLGVSKTSAYTQVL